MYLFMSIQEINENLNFDEQILEAAKSIMNAAGALISAATLAQKEIVSSQGKVSRIKQFFLLIYQFEWYFTRD